MPDILRDTVPESTEYPMAQFIVTVAPEDGLRQATVAVQPALNEAGQEPPFVYWMAFAEYLLNLTATKSDLPYEDALAKLVEGARTWAEK